MPSITFDDFSFGLDLRRSSSVAEANRLRVLTNAYVTTGKAIRKRPGVSKIATLESGTIGLVSGGGKLNTFWYGTSVTHSDSRFQANELKYSTTPTTPLRKIHYGDVFNGYVYLAVEDGAGVIRHHYVDPAATYTEITDAGCPHTRSVTKQASRIWAIGDEQVNFCELNQPTVWTSTGTAPSTDAGFLATGRNARGSATPTGLAQYEGRLVVFHSDAIQLWDVSEDATLNSFWKAVDGLGSEYYRSPMVFAGDILFLSQSGFRSITTQTYSENLRDVDVGSPIDNLILPSPPQADQVLSAYYPAMNQYWALAPGASDTTVWVYSFSRSAKVAAWSKFTLGFVVDDVASHQGGLYLRSGDDVYLVDGNNVLFRDDTQTYEMRVEFPFLDFKTPGVTKHIAGMDVAVTGTVDIQFRYDPQDETKITDPITVTGNTQARALIPVEITAPAIAPVFTSTSSDLVQVDAFTFHYTPLGVTG